MKFKVCGLFNEENINQVADLNPDYIGHIFWNESVRYVNGSTPKLKREIIKTGVFFNSNIDDIDYNIQKHELNCVQLHGDEPPEICKEIMNNGIKVIKSFRIDDNFDFSTLIKYEEKCDLFLFDSRSDLPGGSGKSFNWKILKKYNLKKEFFISGGIGIESVQKLTELNEMELPLYGIDVNSKFEGENHLKQIDKLKIFIKTVKNEI